MDVIRWGIAGPGRIARKFATDMKAVSEVRVVSVASRSAERGQAFADEVGAERVYDSYQGLAADPEIDAVYVATPHSHHPEPVLACLTAGKAVLCEKPLAATAAAATAMVDRARTRGVFLMEAMWTRFLPVMATVRGWIDGGRIGSVRIIEADFGFRSGWNPESRLLDPALAGGALLDVGIYVLAFARWVAAMPAEETRALGHLGETGVDEQTAIVQRFPGGVLANLCCAVRTGTRHLACIHGTDGRIEIPHFWQADQATLVVGEARETVSLPLEAGGFEYEIREVGRCLRAGSIESPGMPLAESLELARTMDRVREQLGLRYPFETGALPAHCSGAERWSRNQS